jgi:ureidoglycolate lyase
MTEGTAGDAPTDRVPAAQVPLTIVLLGDQQLVLEPLTADAFKPFGDVIEATDAAKHFSINQGYAERFDRLAHVDVAQDGGQAAISIFRARARPQPLQLTMLEKHPLGSQAFMPLSGQPYLVVVALGADQPDLKSLRCFAATGQQGVNYAKGTWHHPLLALHDSDFLVLDRAGVKGEENCVVYLLSALDEANSPLQHRQTLDL